MITDGVVPTDSPWVMVQSTATNNSGCVLRSDVHFSSCNSFSTSLLFSYIINKKNRNAFFLAYPSKCPPIPTDLYLYHLSASWSSQSRRYLREFFQYRFFLCLYVSVVLSLSSDKFLGPLCFPLCFPFTMQDMDSKMKALMEFRRENDMRRKRSATDEVVQPQQE